MNIEPHIQTGTGRLCWTLTSNGYKYYTWNLALMWQRVVGPTQRLLVVCADRPSYEFLRREGVGPCVLVPPESRVPDFGPAVVPIGSKNFMSLNRLKLRLLETFAADSRVRSCIYMDGDIAIYQPFLDDIEGRFKHQPLWFQCDERGPACAADASGACPNVCTGLIAFNHGIPPALFRVDDEALWRAGYSQDQTWVNTRLGAMAQPYGVLPRAHYPNGAVATATHADPLRRQAAYLLHYNFRVGDAKRLDMKRLGDWHLPY